MTFIEKDILEVCIFNHRTYSIIFASAIFFFLSSPSANAEIHSSQSFSGIYYHVEGDSSNSFYPSNDLDYLYEGKLELNNIFKGENEFFGNMNYRSTNDKLIDAQSFSIESMYMGVKGQRREILAGDFYQSFSDYSLSNALKGLKLSFGDDKSRRFILLGGIDTTRWEDLWEVRQEDSASRRYVWGARLENKLCENKLALNFNYAGARDDTAYINIYNQPILVNVFSVDAKYKINSFATAYSEIARSFTDEDVSDSAIDSKSDYAIKFGADLNFDAYTLNSAYSRIGNHFTTTAGFSAQDLEAFSFEGLWFLPADIKFTHYLRSDRDNISRNKVTTTKQLNPGGKFSLELPLDIDFEFGADLRKRFSTNKETNDKTYTFFGRLSRDFDICYAEFGYNKIIVSDRIYSANERKSDIFYLGLDGSFTLKKVKFSWNFGEDIDHTTHTEVDEADFTTTTSAGLKLTFPSTLTVEARFSFSDNNYYLDDTDSDSTNYFFSIARNLKPDGLTFQASYERTGYNYYGGAGNYAENIIQAGLKYVF